MSDVIQQVCVDSQLCQSWYSWGVIVGFLGAMVAMAWVFVDASRGEREATVWKSLVAVGAVLVVPALLARLHSGFAVEMQESLEMIAYLSILGLILAVGALVGYMASARSLHRCERCNAVQQPGWIDCPYHAKPNNFGTQFNDVVMPIREPMSNPSGDIRVARPTSDFNAVGDLPYPGAGPSRKTRIIGKDDQIKPLAMLAIVATPTTAYINQTLPLPAGTTTLGRSTVPMDPEDRHHAIDDDSVSRFHLKVRYDESLTAFRLNDLGSANGTTVNGQRIVEHMLKPNDQIVVGKTRLVFMEIPRFDPETVTTISGTVA